MASDINLTPTASQVDIRIAGSGQSPAVLIPARTWGTPGECVAGALLVHGLGAHSGWFEALARRLKIRRVFALAYDQVGFGRRRNESFSSRQQWFHDLITAYRHLSQLVGEDKPVYIMANSMGAALALKVVCDGSIKPSGLVMFSPGFDGHPSTFKLSYRLSAIVKALLSPEAEITLPYTAAQITGQEAVRNWIDNDPDHRFAVPGKMLLELLKLSYELSAVKRLNCPLFMLTAGQDTIVDGKVSERIFNRLEAPSKKRHQFEQAWHDLMFDPVIDQLVDEVALWISQTSKVPPEKLRVG